LKDINIVAKWLLFTRIKIDTNERKKNANNDNKSSAGITEEAVRGSKEKRTNKKWSGFTNIMGIFGERREMA
jgi:hypothetical protein